MASRPSAPWVMSSKPRSSAVARRAATTAAGAPGGRPAGGVEAMDEIVVLDAGRGAERGSHRRLLEHGGRYAEFWEARGRPRT